ncbi:MAG: hypothetical protein JRJ00_08260, partial [Deltaproteobacteria bacterium]|nr:hypothetical protein [Deltaproteobacteria bacterium]
MQTKEKLEHNVALLKNLLGLEHNRLMFERDRANEWETDSKNKAKTIEELKQKKKKTQS